MVAESISRTLTVMGTEEQIALVDSIIDQVDRRRPQVAIEMSLVEMSSQDLKQWMPNFGEFQFGEVSLNFVDNLLNNSTLSWSSSGTGRLSESNHHLPFNSFSLDHRFNTNRAKVLANPTIVALDGQPSTINVTDQVATINATTVTSGGAATTTFEITTAPVGVQITVTPTIFDDGSVVLNLNPNVSRPGATISAGSSQTTLTSTRSFTIGAVRVQDGQTLVIGGILNNTENTNERKVPLLGDIPLVGGLFKSSGTPPNTTSRTELIVLVTPHIIKDPGVSYFENPPQAQNRYSNPNAGTVQPVSLPKFIGNPPLGNDTSNTLEKSTNQTSEPVKDKTSFLPWQRKKQVPTPEESNLKPIEASENALTMPAVDEKSNHNKAFRHTKKHR